MPSKLSFIGAGRVHHSAGSWTGLSVAVMAPGYQDQKSSCGRFCGKFTQVRRTERTRSSARLLNLVRTRVAAALREARLRVADGHRARSYRGARLEGRAGKAAGVQGNHVAAELRPGWRLAGPLLFARTRSS